MTAMLMFIRQQNLKHLFAFILLFFGFSVLSWSQNSQMPVGPGNYLQLSSKNVDGSRDRVNVVFFEVPDTVTGQIYFAINDPETDTTGTNVDAMTMGGIAAPVSVDTEYWLIGGSGAYTTTTARQDYYDAADMLANRHVAGGIQLGNNVWSSTFDLPGSDPVADEGWYYFPPVNASQGEKIGNKYYFRIVTEITEYPDAAPPTGSSKNGYQVDVSSADNGPLAPTNIPGVRSFAYSLSIGLDIGGALWNFYPFVPDSAGGWMTFSNWDFDNDGTPDEPTAEAYNITEADPLPPGTAQIPSPVISDDGSDSDPDVVRNSSYQILTENGGTWLVQVDEGTFFANNTSEVWFWNSAGDITSPQGSESYPTTSELLPIYSDFYQSPLVPYTLSVISSDTQAAPGGTDSITVTLQTVDSNGDPEPFSRDVHVTVNNGANIDTVSSDPVYPGGQVATVSTDTNGIGYFTISDAAAETVTVNVYWDGFGTSDNTYTLPGNQNFDIIFQVNPEPSISSAFDTQVPELTATALPLITVEDSVTSDIVLVNTYLFIRLNASLNAQFDTTVLAPGFSGGNAVNVNPAVTYNDTTATPDPKYLRIALLADFDVNESLYINGLVLDNTSTISSGNLEMSWDNGATWVSDTATITVYDPAASHTWVGGYPGFETDWDTQENWLPVAVPGPGDSPSINPTVSQPLLGSNTQVTDLSLAAGATLGIGAFDLTLTGDLNHSGTSISGGGGNISVAGTTSLTGDLGSGGGGITLSDVVTLSGARTINSGGGNISFGAAIEGSAAGSDDLDLTATTGAVSFVGAIGGAVSIQDLTIDLTGGGTITGNLPAITANGATGDLIVTGAASAVIQSGPLVTSSLQVDTTVGIIDFTDPGNDIDAFSLNTNNAAISLTNTTAVQALAAGSDASGGNITISNAGTLTIAGGLTSAGGTIDIDITGGTGQILLNADIDAGAAGTVNLDTGSADEILGTGIITAGTVALQTLAGSSGNVGTAVEPITVTGTVGSLTLGGGSLGQAYVDTNGVADLTLAAVNMSAVSAFLQVEALVANPLDISGLGPINAGAGSIYFRSGTNLTTAGDLTIIGAAGRDIVLDAPNGLVTVGANLSTTAGVLGDVIINAGTSVVFNNGVAVQTGTGGLNISAVDSVTQNTGGVGSLQGNDITVITQKDSPGGTITITEPDNHFPFVNLQSLTASGLAISDGDIQYSDASNFEIFGAGGISTTGDITLVADADSAGADGGITQTGIITNNGGTSLMTLSPGAGGSATLGLGNDFTTVSLSNGLNASLNDINAIVLGASTLTGFLTVNTGGPVTQSGVLAGTVLTVATDYDPAGAAAITLNTQTNVFGSVALATYLVAPALGDGNITYLDIDGFDIAAAGIRSVGDVTLAGAGNITQTGTIINNGGASLTTLSPGAGNSATLGLGNDFTNARATNGLDATLNDINAVILGASSVTGALSVDAGGAINQTGILSGASLSVTTDYSPGGADAIVLNPFANAFGSVSLIVYDAAPTIGDGNILYRDSAGFDISVAGIRSLGDVTLTGAGGGPISQTGTILNNAAGSTTSITAPGAIVTLDQNNDFTVAVVSSAQDATLTDINDIDLGASILTGDLIVTAGASGPGSIIQSGALSVDLTSTFNAPGGSNVILDTSWNILDGSIDFNHTSGLGLLDITLYNSPAIVLDALSVTGTLTVRSLNGVSNTGALSGLNLAVTTQNAGGAPIDLSAPANSFTNVSLRARDVGDAANAAGQIDYTDTDGFNITGAGIRTTVAANLTAGAAGALAFGGVGNSVESGSLAVVSGAVSQTQPILVTGLSTFNVGGSNAISLANGGNNFGTFTVSSASNDVTVTDLNGILLGGKAGPAGFLTVNTGGPVTQSGVLAGTVLTVATDYDPAGAAAITLNTQTNVFGSVALATYLVAPALGDGNITYLDIDGFDIAAAGIRSVGDVTLVSGGLLTHDITQTGTIVDSGLLTVDAGLANIVLALANDFGSISFSGEDVSGFDNNGFGISALSVTGDTVFQSTGNTITQLADILGASIGGNLTLNTATTNWATNNFNLDVTGNFIGGTLIPLAAGGDTITVGGDFQPDILALPGNSTIQLTGAGPTIGDAASNYIFYNLIVNNNATLNMNTMTDFRGDLTIVGVLNDGGDPIRFVGIDAASQTQNLDMGGTLSFSEITVLNTGVGGATTLVLQSDLDVSGTLTINSAVDILQAGAFSFDIGTLVNNGRFELIGTNVVQTIGAMDVDSGIVSYTGNSDGTISLPSFYDLELSGQGGVRTYTLGNSIDVNGSISILANSILDASGANHDILLAGDFDNQAGVGGFEPRQGNLILDGFTLPQSILGGGTFYDLTIDESPGPVMAKNVNFSDGLTIFFRNGGTFYVRGDDTGNRVALHSTDEGTPINWQIDISAGAVVVDFQWVDIWYSTAVTVNIPKPADADLLPAPANCPGWVIAIPVDAMATRDDTDYNIVTVTDNNGKINYVHMRTSTNLNGDFSDVDITVAGYEIINLYLEPAASNHVIIEVREKPYLDTGVITTVTIANNNSLKDSATGLYIVEESTFTTVDEAPPIIAYTLAVADRDEIFVRFSEDVLNLTDITTPDGLTNTLLFKPDLSSDEYVFDNGTPITASDLLTQNLTANAGITDALPAANALADPVHVISDIALGIVGNGIIEPVFAKNDIANPSGGIGPGVVTAFDGSEFLEPEDITFQAHVNSGVLGDIGPFDVWMKFSSDVPSQYKNNDGLWLPYDDETQFSGLVPYPFAGLAAEGPPTALNAELLEHNIPGDDIRLADGNDIALFFWITSLGQPILAARVPDDTASTWYRQITPWSWMSRSIVTQAGGITILNNIINPNRNESTTVHYELKRSGMVTIQIFDLAGGMVEVLQRGHQSAGEYSVSWNGRNRSGNVVARGIYFVRYVGPGGIDQIRKILVVK